MVCGPRTAARQLYPASIPYVITHNVSGERFPGRNSESVIHGATTSHVQPELRPQAAVISLLERRRIDQRLVGSQCTTGSLTHND